MGEVYELTVLGFKGEKRTIDVANSEREFNSTTVVVFKEKIVHKFPKLKGQNFKVLYADVQLEDEDTFSKHRIERGSLIVLVLRLPGGSDL